MPPGNATVAAGIVGLIAFLAVGVDVIIAAIAAVIATVMIKAERDENLAQATLSAGYA